MPWNTGKRRYIHKNSPKCPLREKSAGTPLYIEDHNGRLPVKLIPPFHLSLDFPLPPLLLDGQKAHIEKGEKTARGEREGTQLPSSSAWISSLMIIAVRESSRRGPRRGEDESPGTFRKKAGGVQPLTGGQFGGVQGGGGRQAVHWDCWMKDSRLQTPQSQDSVPAHLRGLRPVARLTGWYQGCPVWVWQRW